MEKQSTELAKAVFIDKDGTLIDDVPYNVNPEKITLTAGAGVALQQLQKDGYQLIVVTNQSGVARGFFSEAQLQGALGRLCELLSFHGVILDGLYYCPHHPDGVVADYAIDCECRKPLPGMILDAAKNRKIDLSRSWMIGDILNDVECGNAAGCKTILIDNGNETEWIMGDNRKPTVIVNNLIEAVDVIMQHEYERAGQERD